MFNQNDTEKDTPDIDTIEETNWENANALVNKLMGVDQKWSTLSTIINERKYYENLWTRAWRVKS